MNSSSRITGTVKTAITMAAMIVNNSGLLSIACCIKVPPDCIHLHIK